MELLVLTQNNCRYCGLVKQFLNDQQIEFKEVNTSDEPDYIDRFNIMGAPTIVLVDENDEEIVRTTGFNKDDLEEMIEQL